MSPDLDRWIARPHLSVVHRRTSSAPPDTVWECARGIRLREAGLLGRLVRWRIPGLPGDLAFDELFRRPPFIVLMEDEQRRTLVSGLVGRIWTLRRDYPHLGDPAEFSDWSRRGTARVLFAHWVQPTNDGRCELVSESRVEGIGMQGRLGVRTVRPLVRAFNGLIGSEGIAAAVRCAETA
jgi:hypothetical protein